METTRRLGRRIAAGRHASVYQWGPDQVVKVYVAGHEKQAGWECEMSRVVNAAGLNAPKVHGVVQVNGGAGVVFDRVVGKTAGQVLARQPWAVKRVARRMAEVHATLHALTVQELPPLVPRLWELFTRRGPLPVDYRQKALGLLSKVREENRVSHGDAHLQNVIFTRSGPVLVDWIGATNGHPLFDTAKFSMNTQIDHLPRSARPQWLWGMGRVPFIRTYLQRYLELRPDQRESLADWQALVAASQVQVGREPWPGTRRAVLNATLEGQPLLPAGV